MFVNLASSGFSHLMLSIHLEADYNIVGRAWETIDLKEGEQHGSGFHYNEFAGFRRGGKNYIVFANLTVNAEEGSDLTLVYNFIEAPVRKVWRDNLSKLERLLDRLEVPCSVVPSASGSFSSDRFKPMLGLPLMRFNTPNEFFDEIRGFRIARLKDGSENDSVALDMHDESAFHVYAQTNYSTNTSSHIPTDALARLTKLRDHAITEIRLDISEEA